MERDLAARKLLHTTVFSHCYSPCGKYLAAANNYGQIAVFSLTAALAPEASDTTLRPVFVFEASEDGAIFTLASTGTILISGGNGPIKAWKWSDILNRTPRVLWSLNIPKKGPFSQPEINSIVINTEGDGSEIFAGCGDNNVYVWDLESGQQKMTLSGHENYVHSVALKNSNTCASASEDGSVKIWDTRTPSEPVHNIEPYKNELCCRPKFGKWIGCVAMDNADDWLVCGGGPSLSLWHLRSLTATTIFDTPGSCQQCVMFHDDSIISAGTVGAVNHWSVNGERRMAVPTTPKSVFKISVNDTSNSCKVCGGGPSLSLWHLRSLTATTVFDTPGSCQQCVMFHDDSIISAGTVGAVNHWSVNGERRMAVPTTPKSVFKISVNDTSNSCKVLCSTGNSAKVDIFTNFGYKAFSFIFSQI